MALSDKATSGLTKASEIATALRAKQKLDVSVGLYRKFEPLPTGIAQFDEFITGIGGFPRGAITEIAGPSGSAKSAFLYATMAHTQACGGTVALLQPEDAFESEWTAKIGVDGDSILQGDFSTTEEAFELIFGYVQARVDLVAVDSIARLIPRSDFEQYLQGKNRKMSEQAKVFRFHLGMLLNGFRSGKVVKIPRLRDSNTALLLVNHMTASMNAYGQSYTTTGGTAIQYDPHFRISTWHKGWSDEKDSFGRPLKQKIKVKQEKSRLQWGAKGSVEFWLTSGGKFEEADDADFVLNMASEKGIIEKSGAWITLKSTGERFQGKDRFLEYLNEDLTLKRSILSAAKQDDDLKGGW